MLDRIRLGRVRLGGLEFVFAVVSCQHFRRDGNAKRRGRGWLPRAAKRHDPASGQSTTSLHAIASSVGVDFSMTQGLRSRFFVFDSDFRATIGRRFSWARPWCPDGNRKKKWCGCWRSPLGSVSPDSLVGSLASPGEGVRRHGKLTWPRVKSSCRLTVGND